MESPEWSLESSVEIIRTADISQQSLCINALNYIYNQSQMLKSSRDAEKIKQYCEALIKAGIVPHLKQIMLSCGPGSKEAASILANITHRNFFPQLINNVRTIFGRKLILNFDAGYPRGICGTFIHC